MLPSNGAARCYERFPLPSVARRHACQPPSWTAREMPSPLSDAGCTLRPTHRLGVSRCSVTPLDRPSTVQCTTSTPGGIRTRSLRIESPASFQVRPQGRANSDEWRGAEHLSGRPPCRCRLAGIGHQQPDCLRSKSSWLRRSRAGLRSAYSGGRDRTCASRLTVARLTARPHRNERRKERESNPQGRGPPVFETGYRARWQSFQQGDPGRTRTCTTPIKSRPLYRIELRSQRCGRQESNLHAPRFKRALYLIGATTTRMGEAGFEPATSCL